MGKKTKHCFVARHHGTPDCFHDFQQCHKDMESPAVHSVESNPWEPSASNQHKLLEFCNDLSTVDSVTNQMFGDQPTQ